MSAVPFVNISEQYDCNQVEDLGLFFVRVFYLFCRFFLVQFLDVCAINGLCLACSVPQCLLLVLHFAVLHKVNPLFCRAIGRDLSLVQL